MPTDWNLYACDFDTGAVQFIPQSDLDPQPPGGAAGGDLGGTYPNPSVVTVPDGALSANIPIMTAGVLPAVDGSLLTNLPGGSVGQPGTCSGGTSTLDGTGTKTFVMGVDIPPILVGGHTCGFVACPVDLTGMLLVSPGNFANGDTITVVSSLGVTDSGREFNWIVPYF